MQFRTATILGLLGLLPLFLFTLLILRYPGSQLALEGFYYYAGVVLSFLSGIHWGLLAQTRRVGKESVLAPYWIWSTIPPLVSTVLLWWKPHWWGFVVLTFLYILQYLLDVRLTKLSILPYWLLQLRRILTSISMVAFITVLIRTF